MAQHYTHTHWYVKPGREADFVQRWRAFAGWSAAEGLAASARLLRDVDDPSHYISFGPWETLEAVRRWRGMPGFQEHVVALSEVVDRFEPKTLELVAER